MVDSGKSLPSVDLQARLSQGYDAREIANFFLDRASERHVEITQITLQKVLYFAHAWFLARQDVPLVDEQFEAWPYGPVLRSIHEQFRQCGDEPIRIRATRLNFVSGQTERAEYSFDASTVGALERIFDFYSRYEPFALVEMTHEAGGPWDRVFREGRATARVGMIISNTEIREHFAKYYTRRLYN
jgi:uncharacterized phage-associated protein